MVEPVTLGPEVDEAVAALFDAARSTLAKTVPRLPCFETSAPGTSADWQTLPFRSGRALRRQLSWCYEPRTQRFEDCLLFVEVAPSRFWGGSDGRPRFHPDPDALVAVITLDRGDGLDFMEPRVQAGIDPSSVTEVMAELVRSSTPAVLEALVRIAPDLAIPFTDEG